MTRPQSIARFEILFLLAIALQVVIGALGWHAYADHLAAGDPRLAHSAPTVVGGAIAATMLVGLLLWWLVARRASPIGKWLVALIAVAWIVFSFPAYAHGRLPANTADWLNIASLVLFVIAAAHLFLRDARPWFARG